MTAFAKKTFFTTFVTIALSALTLLADDGSTSDWRILLDATHTNGWKMCGPGGFQAVDGELCATEHSNGVLWYSEEKLGNCQFRVTFKLQGKDDNSGFFIRMPAPPKDGMDAVNSGYEVQIIGRHDEYHRTGCLYSLSRARTDEQPKYGEWNTMLVTLDGDRTVIDLNGRRITDYREGDVVPPKHASYEPDRGPRPETGYIGLQIHGANTRTLHFKEVSVRPLPKP